MKYKQVNFAIENINFAAGSICNIEHPANMVLLTESERFVQIFALLVDNKGQYE